MRRSNKGFGAFFLSLTEYRRFAALPPDWRSVVCYSESGQDWHHFQPLVAGLLAQGRQVSYVSSDRNDPAFSNTDPLFRAFYIKSGFWMILFFQMLSADVLLLTMTDLHTLQAKRSVHPVHYIYFFHAMGSTHMVDFANSYDHYDSILCSGPHQMREIRAREAQKGLRAKQLVPHGYARVEKLARDCAAWNPPAADGRIHVLLAPTWGPDSILNVCGEELVGILLEAGFALCLRPHWQTVKLSPAIVGDIRRRYGSHPQFRYEEGMGDMNALFASDLLICDWSSMSIEYALGLCKPVCFIDVPPRVRNPDFAALGLEPLEISIRTQVGDIVSPGNLAALPDIIRRLAAHPDRFKAHIETLRNEMVFNYGSSVTAGVEAIAAIADTQRGIGTASPSSKASA